MTDYRGTFVWFELMTTDDLSANRFYETVFGWKPRDAGAPSMRYTLMQVGESLVGGTMALPADACAAGARPGWIGFIAVDDVDASVARARELGGSITHEPSDIPTVGRWARLADPGGAPFILFRPMPPADGVPTAPVSGTPGTFGWSELHSSDWTKVWPFYAELLGWQKNESIDMGPMGTYQTFKSVGGDEVGGMMKSPLAPSWLFYAYVEDIDAGARRAEEAGAKILSGPHQVPGGSWVLQAVDPQGARFAMLGPRY